MSYQPGDWVVVLPAILATGLAEGWVGSALRVQHFRSDEPFPVFTHPTHVRPGTAFRLSEVRPATPDEIAQACMASPEDQP